MSFRPNLAPSAILKLSEEDESQKLTKGDYKKMKELEEARKLAQVPAMKDERGRDINPHIPQYIMQSPWFYDSVTPTLKHQRKPGFDEEQLNNNRTFNAKKQIKRKLVVTSKFREGACENCGAIDHKRKDCFEAPRKVMAKYAKGPITSIDIEVKSNIKNNEISYDAKRDRYKDLDVNEYKESIERYNRKEELQRQLKARELEEKLAQADDETKKRILDKESEEVKTGEDLDMPGQKFDSKQRESVRNLRLRENIPKYLLNLDENSAYYDPKSRSMRANPFENTGKSLDEVPFAGDNYIRYGSDVKNMVSSQVFCWEMNHRGVDIHLQAEPTKAALLEKQMAEKAKEKRSYIDQEILNEYGGEEYLTPLPKELIYGVSTAYFEYDDTGKVIKGPERKKAVSCYDEDVHPLNHTSVWGSFYINGKWAYKCCRQIEKNCYCIGDSSAFEKPKIIISKINEEPKINKPDTSMKLKPIYEFLPPKKSDIKPLEQNEFKKPEIPLEVFKTPKNKEVESKDKKSKHNSKERNRKSKKHKKKESKHKHHKKSKRRRKSSSSSSDSSSSDSENELEKAVQIAMRKEAQRLKSMKSNDEFDDRRRKYNSVGNAEVAPSKAEMEAYKRMKLSSKDPMNKFKNDLD